MRRYFARVAACILSVVLVVSPAVAQENHVVDQAAIEAALSEHLSENDLQREAVLRVLQRPEVRALAGAMELDWKRAEAAVQTLEDEELAEIASMAREAETGLVGGASITISTTTIIIALLVLILIIVAVK
jgi:hypothetical protein